MATNMSDRQDLDPNSVGKNGRQNRRRDHGNGRVSQPSQPDFSNRKPVPQRQRSGVSDRQRETIAQKGTREWRLMQNQRLSQNGNHLLNKPRDPTRQRFMSRAQFAKELYLQANCQFVVKDGSDYTVQANNPDILVDWDLVEQVRIASVSPSVCPICLNLPSAGKITQCGHIYCWPCILHYLSLGDNHQNKCTICQQEIQKKDLRSVKMLEKVEYKVGDVITLKLMKREKTSTYAVPISSWENAKGRPQTISDEQNTQYAKVLVASDAEILTSVIKEERRALEALLLSAECSEDCFVKTALEELFEREISLQQNTEGFDHDNCNKDSGMEERPKAKTATVPTPAVSMPLLLNGSHGRRKPSTDVEQPSTDVEQPSKDFEQPSTDVPLKHSKSKSRRGRGADKSGQFFFFYQASDGQPIYMHSVNAGCITYEYGGLEHGPETITVKIIDKEVSFMDESRREHMRYLNHLPLRCEYQVLEVDLQPPIVSTETLHHFSGALNRLEEKRAFQSPVEMLTIEEQEELEIYSDSDWF